MPHLSAYPPLYLSICLSVCLSIYLSQCYPLVNLISLYLTLRKCSDCNEISHDCAKVLAPATKAAPNRAKIRTKSAHRLARVLRRQRKLMLRKRARASVPSMARLRDGASALQDCSDETRVFALAYSLLVLCRGASFQ